MADLSNTSYGIGAAQGMAQGITNAGNILNIVRQKEADAREQELFPLRKQQLEQGIEASKTQGAVAKIDLANKEREQKLLTTPWSPETDPMLKDAKPEERAIFIQRHNELPEGIRGTLAGKHALVKQSETDMALSTQITKLKMDRIKRAEEDLATEYKTAMDSKDPKQIEGVTQKVHLFRQVKALQLGEMDKVLQLSSRETSYKSAMEALKNNPRAAGFLKAAYESNDDAQLKNALQEIGKQALYTPKTGIEMVAWGLQIGGEEGKKWGDMGAKLIKEEQQIHRDTLNATKAHYAAVEKQAAAQMKMVEERYKNEDQLKAIEKYATKVVETDPENPDKKTTYISNLVEAEIAARKAFPKLFEGTPMPTKEAKVLDDAKATEFYEKAGKDPDKARALAIKEGYTIPPDESTKDKGTKPSRKGISKPESPTIVMAKPNRAPQTAAEKAYGIQPVPMVAKKSSRAPKNLYEVVHGAPPELVEAVPSNAYEKVTNSTMNPFRPR
jgi:hypothetical protein